MKHFEKRELGVLNFEMINLVFSAFREVFTHCFKRGPVQIDLGSRLIALRSMSARCDTFCSQKTTDGKCVNQGLLFHEEKFVFRK